MKILSSIQNNLFGNLYNDPKKDRIVKENDNAMVDDILEKAKKNKETDNILSNTEKNTLHLFFGTQMPEDMKLYGNNNVNQIHKGKLLDLKG